MRPTWVPPQSSTENGLRHAASAVGPHRHDPDLVAVFLAEQRAGAGRDGLVDRHQPGDDGLVLEHEPVGDVLDRRDLGVASSASDG